MAKPRMTKARLAERRAEAWQLYVKGWTQYQIAERFELDQSTVSDDIRAFQAELPQQTREQLINMTMAGLAEITREFVELAAKPAPPVTAGAQGFVVRDPETDAIVRDYAGKATALREWRTTLAQLAKLAGLNAADKVEISGEVTVEGSVDAEIRRLTEQLGIQDPADLPSGYAPAGLSEGVGSDAPNS